MKRRTFLQGLLAAAFAPFAARAGAVVPAEAKAFTKIVPAIGYPSLRVGDLISFGTGKEALKKYVVTALDNYQGYRGPMIDLTVKESL